MPKCNRYWVLNPISPFIFLQQVNVELESKKVVLRSVVVKPTDTLKDLKEVIKERMVARGDALHNISDDVEFFIKPLFAAVDGGEGIEDGGDMEAEDGKKKEKKQKRKKSVSSSGGGERKDKDKGRESVSQTLLPIESESIPILQYWKRIPPQQGSTILVRGGLVVESDKPKQCFSKSDFVAGESTMTYYTCKDCNVNWLCSACAEVCHADHEKVHYIKDHKPNWACCYCVKYKKCKLVVKKKKSASSSSSSSSSSSKSKGK